MCRFVHFCGTIICFGMPSSKLLHNYVCLSFSWSPSCEPICFCLHN
uniref:Uncharacterized protein n=1 Tax=Arundo donax TaxID=35708 RepID=A0A0A9U3B0_ARUDO